MTEHNVFTEQTVNKDFIENTTSSSLVDRFDTTEHYYFSQTTISDIHQCCENCGLKENSVWYTTDSIFVTQKEFVCKCGLWICCFCPPDQLGQTNDKNQYRCYNCYNEEYKKIEKKSNSKEKVNK